MTNPDFIKLAEAMGVKAIRCSTAGELPEKMKEFLAYDNSKPVLMECLVERNEHVFPMVSPPYLQQVIHSHDSSVLLRYLRARPCMSKFYIRLSGRRMSHKKWRVER